MSAQSWSVKGIDPKIREAAREAAARKGMTLVEFLNQAIAETGAPPSARARASRLALDDDGDWDSSSARPSDAKLAQRVESIERRTQLAFTGLDRAVTAIDRSVLGLASRIEDAEAISSEASERIAQALEQFRLAGETLSGRLERAEQESVQGRRALDEARFELTAFKDRLETQVSLATELASRAEATASLIATEIENGGAGALADARLAAERAAQEAREVSASAVRELRSLQEELEQRFRQSETSTRQAIEGAIADVSEAAERQVREAIAAETAHATLELTQQLRADHAALVARVERAEANARESTAGLRQAAGAAIADLRNAQLALASRVKQVEDAETGGHVDLTDIRHAQQDIAERLRALETKTEINPVADALSEFEARIANAEAGAQPRLDAMDGAVRSLDDAMQRLAARMVETESTANTAIRALEQTVSSLGAQVEQAAAAEQTEALRAMLEQRLDTMAHSVSKMVDDARTELNSQLQAADGGFDEALTDVNRRLAAAERRQAQTIEAISLEIRRMSESVDARLRAVEARNDDAAAAAVREELTRMVATLERRFDDIERREAAGFDRMGIEVGRLSERLEERVGAIEARSAQAIEQVGEQVARVAERFAQRHDALSRELGERMIDSEERSGVRVSEAIGSIMQRLAEVEERSAEAIAPIQKAVSSVASKLEKIEGGVESGEPADPILAIPAMTRSPAFETFGTDLSDPDPQPYQPTYTSAQPTPAAPLPTFAEDLDFAQEIDDLLIDDRPIETPPAQSRPEQPESFDDLLLEEQAPTPEAAPAEDNSFWAPALEVQHPLIPPEPAVEAEAALEEETRDALFESASPEPEAIPLSAPEVAPAAPREPPPSRLDYLANARKAAQAQSLPKARPELEPTPRLSLRGSSRVVLWGAASVITLMLVGGAWWFNNRAASADGAPAEPTTPPVGASTADPAAPLGAPGEDVAAPADEADPAPVALMDGLQPASSVVAGPLAPRSVSLEQAAQGGDLIAQYELALQQLASGRATEGAAMLRRAADRGFPMAQYRLAKLYERGEGVQPDLVAARQWTERAAAAGNRRAMHDLGVYFARGEGAPLDEAAAFRWFRQAAELGVADSQYNLGVLYQQGRGVNASPSEALFWFLVAARQGDQDAGERAASIEASLPAVQTQQARARAQSFRPRAASAVANGEFGQRPWARSGA
ncbi:MAG: hypothetical protein K2P58_04255 [Hyphomonadaceae bacterium]|nr:hypothetical protein [Hyphomonadaceae bacterium]